MRQFALVVGEIEYWRLANVNRRIPGLHPLTRDHPKLFGPDGEPRLFDIIGGDKRLVSRSRFLRRIAFQSQSPGVER
jgi:hypothetical protein